MHKSGFGSQSKAVLKGFDIKNKPKKSHKHEPQAPPTPSLTHLWGLKRFHFNEAGWAKHLGRRGNLAYPKAISFLCKEETVLASWGFYFIFLQGGGKFAGLRFTRLWGCSSSEETTWPCNPNARPLVSPSASLRDTLVSPSTPLRVTLLSRPVMRTLFGPMLIQQLPATCGHRALEPGQAQLKCAVSAKSTPELEVNRNISIFLHELHVKIILLWIYWVKKRISKIYSAFFFSILKKHGHTNM